MAITSRPMLWRAGAAAYLISVVVYFAAQLAAQRAWTTPYSWSKNVISDLGNTACGQFSVHGPTAYVCSPMNATMNGGFIVFGVLVILGTLALWGFWPATALVRVGQAFFLASGVGKIFVGLFPENTNATIHTVAATNITIMGIGILLLSIAIRKLQPRLARFGRFMSIIGYIAGGLFIAAQFASPQSGFGIGIGTLERFASYPGCLWLVVISLFVLRGRTAFSSEVESSTTRAASRDGSEARA